jgi:hypothetical protein
MRSLLLCAALATGPLAAQVVPAFADGDVAQLRCRVVDVDGKNDHLCWLVVEVENGGDVGAEPLTFRITLAPKKRRDPPQTEVFERVSLPRLGRFGRPAPAGGKQRYWLATSLVGDRRKYDVEVTAASWHRGEIVAEPEFVAGKLEQVQMESLAGRFSVTRVPLKNPFVHDVDALFLVTMTQPSDDVHLIGVRLGAAQAIDWNLTSLGGAAGPPPPRRRRSGSAGGPPSG